MALGFPLAITRGHGAKCNIYFGRQGKLRKSMIIAALCLWAGAAAGDVAQDRAGRLDSLYEQLRGADPEDVQQIESEIEKIELRSGSPAMDFLYQRGTRALQGGDLRVAVLHFTALIDLAPDFAQAYDGRAVAYFQQKEYGLAVADIRRALALNPRDYAALAGLGRIFEETGNPARALQAYRLAQAIHPYLDTVNEAVTRLDAALGGLDL